jgi:hypothetical protein
MDVYVEVGSIFTVFKSTVGMADVAGPVLVVSTSATGLGGTINPLEFGADTINSSDAETTSL